MIHVGETGKKIVMERTNERTNGGVQFQKTFNIEKTHFQIEIDVFKLK